MSTIYRALLTVYRTLLDVYRALLACTPEGACREVGAAALAVGVEGSEAGGVVALLREGG